MAESAALLVDKVLPEQPVRQWVLSFPFQLRFLFASRPEIMGRVLGMVYRVVATHLARAKRGQGSKPEVPDEAQHQTPAERRAAMTWAQRLRRVFNVADKPFVCGFCIATTALTS